MPYVVNYHGTLHGYGVRETSEDLYVWAAGAADPLTASHLSAFLTATVPHLGAHEVRRMLAPMSDLEPLDTPPSAVRPDRV